jgi:hypothetical protein
MKQLLSRIEDESFPFLALIAAGVLISRESCHHLQVVMEFLMYLVQISSSPLACKDRRRPAKARVLLKEDQPSSKRRLHKLICKG